MAKEKYVDDKLEYIESDIKKIQMKTGIKIPRFLISRRSDLSEFVPVSYPGVKPDRYLINRDGQIYSITWRRIMRQSFNKRTGYMKICLQKDVEGNVNGVYLVHRLVAWEFCEGYDESSGRVVVNHKDNNKTHNCSDNLEWVTTLENVRYSYSNGGKHTHFGGGNPKSKYTDEQMDRACQMAVNGILDEVISKELGINISSLRNMYNGQCWVHISSKYDLSKIYLRYKIFDNITRQNIKILLSFGLSIGEICDILSIETNKTNLKSISHMKDYMKKTNTFYTKESLPIIIFNYKMVSKYI